jgi:hypothetical protein
MSVQKVNVLVSPTHSVSPGAGWMGDAVSWLFAGTGSSSPSSQPLASRLRDKLARARAARRRARDTSELLALARRYESTQPEFAKDLFAAARNDRS